LKEVAQAPHESIQCLDGAFSHLYDLLSSLQTHLLAFCVSEATAATSFEPRMQLLTQHLTSLLQKATVLYNQTASYTQGSNHLLNCLYSK